MYYYERHKMCKLMLKYVYRMYIYIYGGWMNEEFYEIDEIFLDYHALEKRYVL